MARTFTHLDPDHPPHQLATVLRWALLDRLTGKRRIAPPGPGAARVEPDLELLQQPARAPRVTWIGHASFLVQIGRRNLLVDPVMAPRLGLFYPRHVPPGLRIADLPPLDAVLVSHSHYDHLDAWTLRRLPRAPAVVVPLGLGRFFRRRGFTEVHELGWWDRLPFRELVITLTPGRHWSRRTFTDTNHSLWGGFVIEHAESSVYHAGDSAYFPGFAEIGRRFSGLDVALLPIGAYRPAWFMEHSHMNPEQAGRAFLDLGARLLVPMHWGTFQLTDESLAEPAERLCAWWRSNGPADRGLRRLAVGESLDLNADSPAGRATSDLATAP